MVEAAAASASVMPKSATPSSTSLPRPISWLADLKTRLASAALPPSPSPSDDRLGILAFEAAATMARLVSLHRSLSPPHFQRLRSDMRSQAISYLVSPDQSFLLRLACADLLSDLDRTAAAVSRLALRCHSTFPRAFPHTFPDAKNGSLMSLEREFGFTKGAEKRVRKMEKQVELAAQLYGEMDTLNDLEAAERRMGLCWNQDADMEPELDRSLALTRRELRAQRHRVSKLKDSSLWQVSFDKAVATMAKAALSILYNLCLLFGQHVHGLPPVYYDMYAPILHSYTPWPKPKPKSSSGPIDSPKPVSHEAPIRHSAPIFMRRGDDSRPLDKLVKGMVPPPTSVGAAGMALRYANVILAAERLLAMRSGNPRPLDQCEDGEEDEWGTREDLYEMLPVGVRAAMKAKLKDCWKKDVRAVADRGVSDGWGQVVRGLLSWLSPIARDTERWHEERNLDRMQRFATGPRTLMLKTLHFANLVKTEAAMVEVLVGLSCMCWYHEQHLKPDANPHAF